MQPSFSGEKYLFFFFFSFQTHCSDGNFDWSGQLSLGRLHHSHLRSQKRQKYSKAIYHLRYLNVQPRKKPSIHDRIRSMYTACPHYLLSKKYVNLLVR